MTRPVSSTAPEGRSDAFHWRALRGLAPYLWPVGANRTRARVVFALALLVSAKLATVCVPLLYRRMVDMLADPARLPLELPLALLVGYGGLRVMQIVFAELRDAVFAKVAQAAIRDVALSTFRHLHALALRFHLERQTGGLSRAIERGTKGIDFLLSFMLFNIIPTFIEIALVCGILWRLFDARYALVTLATIVAYIAFTLGITEWRTQYRRRMNETDSQANTRAIDSLLNYETVKYFGNEEFEARRYDEALARYERAAVSSKRSLALLNIGQASIIGVGLTVVMAMAGQGVIAHRMTVGDFVLVNTYLIQLYIPLNFLGFVYREMKQSLIDMESMFRLLSVESEVRDAAQAQVLPAGPGLVEFDKVCFAYDARRPILRDVSFSVAPGTKLAIVGASGTGKSTIARLLFRFYDLTSGAIRIDGIDIRELTQHSLRRALGVVPQDTVLFNDTLYYNILYGRTDATEQEVREAASLAQINAFIAAAPDGFATMVGERGLKLSGGEKQRVAIARTILKRPRVLIFDEATSALDTHTEREIQTALKEVSRGHTTLVIAHRLSTVVDADEIIVLDDGAVAERGTHVTLLAAGGLYARMWQRQQDGEANGLADAHA